MSVGSYAVGVTAVVIISAIGEMITPEGRMKKTVRTAFALVVALTFVSPIIKLKDFEFNFDFPLSDWQTEADDAFLTHADGVRKELIEERVGEILGECGIVGADVVCETTGSGENAQIKIISINLKGAVITENGAHINSYELREKVAQELKTETGRIVVVE